MVYIIIYTYKEVFNVYDIIFIAVGILSIKNSDRT